MKILTYPNSILRQKAQPIKTINQSIIDLAQQILKTIIPDPNDPQGVGLAANQIGVLKRMFVMMLPNKKMEIVINPQILKKSAKMLSSIPQNKQYLEGCLSVPGYYGFVDRPIKIQVSYQTLTGSIKKKTLTYPHTSYFQHEFDHLNGILFIDYIKKSGEQLYLADKSSGKLRKVNNPF